MYQLVVSFLMSDKIQMMISKQNLKKNKAKPFHNDIFLLKNVKKKSHNYLKIFSHIIECNVDGKCRSVMMRAKRALSFRGVFYYEIQECKPLKEQSKSMDLLINTI